MALGTITVAVQGGDKPSTPMYNQILNFAGDADYPTGGTPGFEALVRAKTGKASIDIVGATDLTCDATHKLEYCRATDKLMAFVRATGVEAAAHVDMHGVTFTLNVVSI